MDYKHDESLGEMDEAIEVDGQMMTREQYREHRMRVLDELHSLFANQRDEWVKYRSQSGVETRWRNAQALYHGEDNTDSALVNTLKNGPSQRPTKGGEAVRSQVVVNIVRPKVDQAVARMCEILLPVDDRNWGIKPTPVPDSISAMLGQQAPMVDPSTGQEVGKTKDQWAQEVVAAAKKAAKSMELEIDDVLTQCGYNGEQRKMIEDGVRLGTGLMLGPFPKNNVERRWRKGGDGKMALSLTTKLMPASERADPWDIWFDPACGNDHHRGAGFYHRRFVTRKEIRALIGVPGYDEDCIRTVLRTKPTRTKVAEGRVIRNLSEEDSYEMWVYYGAVEPDEIAMLTQESEDPLINVESGVIIMIGEKVVGALELWTADKSLPIDVWCWRKADDTPYGYGLPDEMGHQQRVVIAAWRQVMDNARMAIGGQLVMKKKMIVPQNGSYALEPLKIWLASEDLEDVTKAMHMFEFNSHITELLTIATTAMQFADQETSMPQILGGDKGSAPETVGGLIMLYNNANVVLRLRVKLYDDNITTKHIRRHYDWQMAHSEKEEIKGDMDIDARGSTALLEKDIQNQATLNLANVTSNPRYAAFLDPKEELRTVLKAFKVTPEDIMLTDAKIEENLKAQAANPPQDPNVVKAQAQMQMKQMDLQDNAEDRSYQERRQTAELRHKQAALQYNAAREESEANIAVNDAQLQRDLALLKAASDEQEGEAERVARGRLEALKLDSKHQLFNAESVLRVQTGQGI